MPSVASRRDWIVFGLLLLPVTIHIGLLGRDVSRLGHLPVSWLDYFFIVGVVVYLGIVAVVMRNPKWSRRFCLVIYSTLLPILGLEAHGLASGFHDVPWTPQLRRSKAIPELPGLSGEIVFSTNVRGVRAPETWPKDRNDRVLCVGGSTTECVLVSDEKTWPWLLGSELTRELKRDILVANAGRAAHITSHHAHQLEHYRLAAEFGTVIALVGFNDALAFTRDNLEEVLARVPSEALMRSSGQRAYYRGTVAMELLYGVWKSSRFNSRYAIRQDGTGAGVISARRQRHYYLELNTIEEMPSGLTQALVGYRNRLRDLERICRKRGQRIIFMTQPTLYHQDMPAELAELLFEISPQWSSRPGCVGGSTGDLQ